MKRRKNPWKRIKKSPEAMKKLRSQDCLLGEITTFPDYSRGPGVPVATRYGYTNRKFPVLTPVIPDYAQGQTKHLYVSLQEVRTFAEWRAREIGALRKALKAAKAENARLRALRENDAVFRAALENNVLTLIENEHLDWDCKPTGRVEYIIATAAPEFKTLVIIPKDLVRPYLELAEGA